MINREDPKLINNARALRRNMTKQERHLWYDFLRRRPEHFYRQRVVGKYIADFYCAAAGLVIELDGSGHYKPEQIEKDKLRTEEMEKMGLTVLRISNYDVDTNFEGVCLFIDRKVKELTADLHGKDC